MILGVLSDTHGNHGLMFEAARLLGERLGAEWLYHAGDDYGDAEHLDWAGYKVRAVPGLWCPQYTDGRTPRRILDRFDDLSLAMAHAEKDLQALDRAATVVVTGHSHRARIEKLGRTLYLNPGHLKAPVDRGEPASFATLRFDADALHAAIHELDGSIRHERVIPRGELG